MGRFPFLTQNHAKLTMKHVFKVQLNLKIPLLDRYIQQLVLPLLSMLSLP